MTGLVVMLVVLAALALLAPFYGADTRDGKDWRQTCDADCAAAGLHAHHS